MTNTEWLRARLLAGVINAPIGDKAESFEQLSEGQWCSEFEQHMRARLLMGRYRYGAMSRQKPNGYDNVGSAIERLRLYQQTGNLEHLVDAANLALVEYVTGQHPNRHFESSDDGIHTAALK